MGQSLTYLPCVPAYNTQDDDAQDQDKQQHEGEHNNETGEDPPVQEIIGGVSAAGGSKSLKLQKTPSLPSVNTTPSPPSKSTPSSSKPPPQSTSPTTPTATATTATTSVPAATAAVTTTTPSQIQTSSPPPTPSESDSTSPPKPMPLTAIEKQKTRPYPTKPTTPTVDTDFFTDMKPKFEAAPVVEPMKPSRLAMDLGSTDVQDSTSAWDDDTQESDGSPSPLEHSPLDTVHTQVHPPSTRENGKASNSHTKEQPQKEKREKPKERLGAVATSQAFNFDDDEEET